MAQAGADRFVVFFGLEQRQRGVQAAFAPRAFPADFVAVAQHGGQLFIVGIQGAGVFEDAGVAGVKRVVRVQVKRYGGIGDEAAFFVSAFASHGKVGLAVAGVAVPDGAVLPAAVRGACNQVEAAEVEAVGERERLGGVAAVAVVAVVKRVPVGARDFAAVPGE